MRIDALTLKAMLVSGANALDNDKEAINNMNVFPVPDGDTGINMSLTLGSVRGLNEEYTSVGTLANDAASAILRSARGNSGAILSLFFRGLAKAWKQQDTVGAAELAAGFRRGCDEAYRAVLKPAEGTILTVMRRSAEEAEKALEKGLYSDATLVEYYKFIIKKAQASLDDTPKLLPVLREVGVVDAGGAGFVTVLNGMMAALEGNPIEQLEPADKVAAADFSEFDTADITFPYCTECVVEKFPQFEGEGHAKKLHELVGSIGDSVVFIEDEKIIKLHVHTDHPGKVLEKACVYGMLLTVKIENMRNQHSELVAKEEAKAPVNQPLVAEPENEYGFVAVCMGRGVSDTFRDLGADTVIHGGQTMNPSTQDIFDGIRKTPAKTVIVLPNNKNIYMVAEQAAKLVKDRKVIVLNTKSVPQGISAMIVFNGEADIAENVAAMNEAISNVTSMSITQAVRNTSIGGEKIKSGQMLGLVDGKIKCVADTTAQCVEMLVDKMNDPSFVTIFYGIDVTYENARMAEASIRAKYRDAEVTLIGGGQPIYDYIISVE